MKGFEKFSIPVEYAVYVFHKYQKMPFEFVWLISNFFAFVSHFCSSLSVLLLMKALFYSIESLFQFFLLCSFFVLCILCNKRCYAHIYKSLNGSDLIAQFTDRSDSIYSGTAVLMLFE